MGLSTRTPTGALSVWSGFPHSTVAQSCQIITMLSLDYKEGWGKLTQLIRRKLNCLLWTSTGSHAILLLLLCAGYKQVTSLLKFKDKILEDKVFLCPSSENTLKSYDLQVTFSLQSAHIFCILFLTNVATFYCCHFFWDRSRFEGACLLLLKMYCWASLVCQSLY